MRDSLHRRAQIVEISREHGINNNRTHCINQKPHKKNIKNETFFDKRALALEERDGTSQLREANEQGIKKVYTQFTNRYTRKEGARNLRF